jgi:hypothetical protein
MRDILRDWRRWSRAERAVAILMVSILTIGTPMAVAINL